MASDEEELVLRSIENDCDDAEHATRHTKMRLLVMTCAIGGLQLIWSTIFAHGTEYLLSLGLSKSMTSIAWIIGPFCGMVIQPFFGVVGANGVSIKLLLFVGATASCFCLAGLATVEDVVMSGVNGANDYAANGGRQGLCSSLALFWILALTLSIQPFQAASRALVVESCHESEQSRGSAWIGRAVAVGNIFGYMLSATPFAELSLLRRFTPFQSLCAVVSSLVMVLVSITCYFAPNSGHVDKERAYRELSISTVISRIGREVRSCSSAARKVMTVQFFSWMAWFPIMYYHTKYLDERYREGHVKSQTGWSTTHQQQRPVEDGENVPSLGSLGFAVVSLLTSFLLPLFLRDQTMSSIKSHSRGWLHMIRHMSLFSVWILGHAWFVVAVLSTFFVQSQRQGLFVIASLGFSWSITAWIPHALMVLEIARSKTGTAVVLTTIHNSAISAPQIVAAFVCSLTFGLLDHLGWENATMVVIRLSVLPALAALYYSMPPNKA